MQCFLCKKNNFKKVYKLKNRLIILCENDRLYFSQANKLRQKIYDKSYFNNVPNTLANNNYYLSKLEKIKRLTNKENPKILDVGCGWGDFLKVLKDQKIPYLGVDVSKKAIQICKAKQLNCKLIQEGDLNDKLTDKISDQKNMKYDAVTMFQVIEHLKNPFPTLSSIKKLLKPGGIILLTTPNNDSPLRKILGKYWSVYNEDSHLVFYDKKNLFNLLNKINFKSIKIRYDNIRYLSFNYVAKRLIGILFPRINPKNLGLNFLSIPTDPWGDLEAEVIK